MPVRVKQEDNKEADEVNEQMSLVAKLIATVDQHRTERRSMASEQAPLKSRSWLRWLGRQLVPNVGTLILVVVLLLTVPSLAAPRLAPQATSTSTMSYQGRLADSGGSPLTGLYNLEFRIYDLPSGGAPLWEEFWTGGNSVAVSDGLFNVMLGSIETGLAASIEGHDELYLGITVGTDAEMVPRVQLGSVPFSLQAMTVTDGSITTSKIADGAVTTEKLNVDDGFSVSGTVSANRLESSGSTKDNADVLQGNMGRHRWTITASGSPLVNWDVEESWIYFGENLYFLQWTLGKPNSQTNEVVVPANSKTNLHLANWKTQEFAPSNFTGLSPRTYLSGVSSAQNLTHMTHWGSEPTVVDFVNYDGVGGVDGAKLQLSNAANDDATVRSFSIQGFVYSP